MDAATGIRMDSWITRTHFGHGTAAHVTRRHLATSGKAAAEQPTSGLNISVIRKAARRRAPRPAIAAFLTAGALLSGCSGNHSALNPASDAAERIASLWWIMLVGAAIIFFAVMALLLIGIARGRGERERSLDERNSLRLVLAGGVVIPAIVLLVLVVGSVYVGKEVISQPIFSQAPADRLTIKVIGQLWWWEVHYFDQHHRHIATTANEIHVPVGRPVRFLLDSPNVIHSFWVPNLHGKIDLIPGQVNSLTFNARHVGIYKGQCAEFCGVQHAKMQFLVVAEPEEQFQRWLQQQMQPAQDPVEPVLLHGRKVFLHSRCIECHTIRGVHVAKQNIGPDLTHVGSRLTLAAKTIPNTIGHMGGWIMAPQDIKPGSLMPPTPLEPEDLRALIYYLQSLE
jgi:cytochrome c oxidase subunit 2